VKNPQSIDVGLSNDLKKKLTRQRGNNNVVHKIWAGDEETSFNNQIITETSDANSLSLENDVKIINELNISKNETVKFDKKKKRKKKKHQTSSVSLVSYNELNLVTIATIYKEKQRLNSSQSLPHFQSDLSRIPLNESVLIKSNKSSVVTSNAEDGRPQRENWFRFSEKSDASRPKTDVVYENRNLNKSVNRTEKGEF